MLPLSLFGTIKLIVLFLVVALLPACVNGSALTTTVDSHDTSCFYSNVDKAGEKIGFYFAVQAGGAFDIDWTVKDPDEKIIIEGHGDRQGDYIFTGNKVGAYEFCFTNELTSFSSKLIDLDIMVESEPRPIAPARPESISQHTSSLEESIYKLFGSLSSIQRTQKYFRTRENRNMATVKSTQRRIITFSILECGCIMGMGFFQVFVVRKFFEGGRRKGGRV